MFCMTPCAWQRFTHFVGKYSSQTFQGMTLVFVFCIIWVGWFVWDFRFAACKQGCHFLSFLGPAFHAFCHLLGYSARVTTGAISGTLTLDSLRSRLAIHVRKGGRTHLCIGPLGPFGTEWPDQDRGAKDLATTWDFWALYNYHLSLWNWTTT